MLLIMFFIICFMASGIGAVCGIGGGVIIKPVLDAFHVMSVAQISFLSGCTVLSMSTYSVIKSRLGKESYLDKKISFFLAVGAAFGGLAGKWLFSYVAGLSHDRNKVGAIQAFCLMLVTIGTLIYTLNKKRITTRKVNGPVICAIIGLLLGIMSSFLGIGGGPINLVVLFFFFSMNTKAAAENSLYIIFFSQLTSLLSTVLSNNIPEVDPLVLLTMVIGGIFGGIFGRALNKNISEQIVDKLFIALMSVIICICVYNMISYGRIR